MMNDIFDYLIIGSGPAGCVLARRLSEEAGVSVCVLEAGGPDRSPYVRMPAGFVKMLDKPAFMGFYPTEAMPSAAGRSIRIPQGRIVGGSSSINGLAYSRGQRQDFDDWSAWGNPGWSYREVLPYFMRSERRIGVADARFRGRSGELPVSNPDWPSALCEAFIEAVGRQGIARNSDYNGAEQDGAGYFQRIIEGGRRVSCADAFLRPALATGRVQLKLRAEAERLLFEGLRATGVLYRQDGQLRRVQARREVLLCAGALNSPKLLQLSGIGPASALQALGLPVHCHLPGVGENLRDHYTVRMVARARDVATLNEYSRGWRLGLEALKWLAGRPSILGLSPSLVHVFCRSRPELDRGDIQVLFTPGSYKEGRNYVLDDHPGMSCGARQQRPFSAGHVRLASPDPRAAPLVQPNYLSDPRDPPVLLAALRLARGFLQSTVMAQYFHSETLPGPQVQTDDEWLDFARRRGSTAYHLVGTCKMGPADDPMAVVDAQLRVHGLQQLRVVDASVMPQVPSANTMAATLMVAEKAADLIRGRQQLAPAQVSR
jgi:choline dehydrogenase